MFGRVFLFTRTPEHVIIQKKEGSAGSPVVSGKCRNPALLEGQESYMNNRSVGRFCKDALGAIYLLVGAFFVCSTLLSMRSVFADPIAPTDGAAVNPNMTAASPRTASGRANARTRANGSARPTVAGTPTAAGRSVSARGVAARTPNSATRQTAARSVVARGTAATSAAATRTVATRTVANNRNIRSRATATGAARVSLTGDAMAGVKGITGNTKYYTYLANKLYTGNYSNIIDSSTGLISADAYSNCLESYYTCMDEICTARNEAQRRCACAGRVKAFAAAEDQLQSANEALIKVSGELALLIANKGKDVSAAFTLTDAEKVMNCASWIEASKNGKAKSSEFGDWCEQHGIYDTSECSVTKQPSYCKADGNKYAFDLTKLDGNGSDILAQLASWADSVKENTDTLLTDNTDILGTTIGSMADTISGLYGVGATLDLNDAVKDKLAQTWGYDLFKYAHNNVCSRVLDSCFNGIYEACGTPTNTRCATGATSSCPYNYSSMVRVEEDSEGRQDVIINERSSSTTSSATCFGYTSSSGDPYSSLRGPVADARRSVMQKYLLDANADCDLYGEQLKTAAQKIEYQKVAAQQALQQKRLEFYTEEIDQIKSDAIAASTNFNECINELLDCYDDMESSNPTWTNARIKTYCAQIANVPHCSVLCTIQGNH